MGPASKSSQTLVPAIRRGRRCCDVQAQDKKGGGRDERRKKGWRKKIKTNPFKQPDNIPGDDLISLDIKCE